MEYQCWLGGHTQLTFCCCKVDLLGKAANDLTFNCTAWRLLWLSKYRGDTTTARVGKIKTLNIAILHSYSVPNWTISTRWKVICFILRCVVNYFAIGVLRNCAFLTNTLTPTTTLASQPVPKSSYTDEFNLDFASIYELILVSTLTQKQERLRPSRILHCFGASNNCFAL